MAKHATTSEDSIASGYPLSGFLIGPAEPRMRSAVEGSAVEGIAVEGIAVEGCATEGSSTCLRQASVIVPADASGDSTSTRRASKERATTHSFSYVDDALACRSYEQRPSGTSRPVDALGGHGMTAKRRSGTRSKPAKLWLLPDKSAGSLEMIMSVSHHCRRVERWK